MGASAGDETARDPRQDAQKHLQPSPGYTRHVIMHIKHDPVLILLAYTDFDAHADSPIEILHVVLLGVVKYFWRDACARQTPDGKEVLKARLTSMNVDGLGISPIRGHTLVYYAKSLVGRDFRIVLQVAPAVLHGMIPDAAYEAWLALGRLAPLIFQNSIDDLPTYIVSLGQGFRNLLITE